MLRGYLKPTGFALALALAAPHATAQTEQNDPTDHSDTIDEIVVMARTGSRISRQSDSPSPLTIHEGADLTDAGLKDIRDMVGVLSINAGAENNSDNLDRRTTRLARPTSICADSASPPHWCSSTAGGRCFPRHRPTTVSVSWTWRR